jgi:hypothetical protein
MVPLIGGAADCVFGYDHTIPVINRAKRSRKNADVGFGACENKGIAVSSHQFMVQMMTGEGRINRCRSPERVELNLEKAA